MNSLKERMQVAHDLARKHLGQNALRMKESYDAKKNLNQYNRGGPCLVCNRVQAT